MKALLIGRGHTGVEGSQLEGFEMYRASLKRRLGLAWIRLDLESLPEVEKAIAESDADLTFVMTSFREKPEELAGMFQRLFERPHRPKLIFLDYFAQSSTPYFGVMPWVDRYAKRQLLRDRSLYQKDFAGGYVFTDWFTKRYNFDLGGWTFGSRPPADQMHKLVLAWNLGVTRENRWILRGNRLLPRRWKQRTIDLNSRLGLGHKAPWEWYHEYRTICQRDADAIGARFKLSGKDRISSRQFKLELRDSRMVFSPFGWGELCFRDYEAVIWGALLVKPSMAHLETHPDVFADRVTYVATEWDNSDLEEKCRYYLEHAEEAEQIIANAQRRLGDYFESEAFVDDVARVVQGLG